jgi:phosphoglycerate dehydrogenase-like enzyme
MGVSEERTRERFRQLAPSNACVVFSDGPHDLPVLLPRADYIVMWTAALTAEHLALASRARLVQKIGEGTDKIDLEAAARLRLLVAKTSGENVVSTAEHTVLMMLACLRRLPEAHNGLARGVWEKWPVREHTFELRGKTVGLLGMGKIGSHVARLVGAFGAQVLYFRRSAAEADGLARRCSTLDELLRDTDILSLHLPLTEETRGMLGARELAMMKPGSILVNTARGGIVDETALIAALKSGALRRAGLDAFGDEPPDLCSELFRLPNVVLSPHVGGVTEDSKLHLVEHAMDNIRRLVSGGTLAEEDIVVDRQPRS